MVHSQIEMMGANLNFKAPILELQKTTYIIY